MTDESQSQSQSRQLLPSLLDRLTDYHDETIQLNASTNRSRVIQFFKRTIKRDLEWLLNSRQVPELMFLGSAGITGRTALPNVGGYAVNKNNNNNNNNNNNPEESEEIRQSVLRYGLPDFSAYNFSGERDRSMILNAVQEAVRRFEPRLSHVHVELEESAKDAERSLRFRIDAMLMLEPTPEPIVFDTVLELNTKSFEVKNEDG